MLVAFVLALLILRPIIVVGSICMLEVLSSINRVIALFILPLPSSKPCIPFIPEGVAALPMPSILEDMFIAICFFVSKFGLLKNLSIGLDSSFAIFRFIPVFSQISKIPSQKAYIEINEKESSTAFSVAEKTLSSYLHKESERAKCNKIRPLVTFVTFESCREYTT